VPPDPTQNLLQRPVSSEERAILAATAPRFLRQIGRFALPAVWVSLVLFAIVLLRTAWLCDDAYITFRTAYNFVNGFGPTWNAAELKPVLMGSAKPRAGLRARAKVGGKNERLREHRLSHFRLQTRRERNWGGRFIGTFPIRGLGEGCFSALSIPCSGGWRLTSVRWDVHRFDDRRKNDLES